MKGRRFLVGLGITLCAVVAGSMSYWHQFNLAHHHGQILPMAIEWPLSVDGVVLVCAVVSAYDRARGYYPRAWAFAGFWAGATFSVVANWTATSGGIWNHVISASPAAAFLVAIEAASSAPRRRRKPIEEPEPEAAPALRAPTSQQIRQVLDAPEPADMSDRMDDLVRNLVDSDPASHPMSPQPYPTGASETMILPVVKPRQQRQPKGAKGARTADHVKKVAAKMPGAPMAQIAAKAGVSESTARRALGTTPRVQPEAVPA